MAQHADYNRFLRTRTNQLQLPITKVASSLEYCNEQVIQRLLELVNTIQDLDMQIKLFSVLSACLTTDVAYREPIILNNQMYAKIQLILAKNLPRKTAVVLNFLTALMYTEDAITVGDRRKSLIVHAQNMIRISGCLASMSNIFSIGMLFHETRIALCQCIAETCRNSEVNQSYCAHLVPMCVAKCSQDTSEVFLVLESLLKNHERNIKLFLESNGFTLFTKEYLLQDACMQLLNIVIRSPTSAKLILEKSNVVDHLRNILDFHGPDTQIGQWAIIILQHAEPYIKGLQDKENTPGSEKKLNLTRQQREFVTKKNPTKISDQNDFSQQLDSDNTTALFQNIFQEILQWRPKCSIPPNDIKQFSKIIESLKNQEPSIDYRILNEGFANRQHKTKEPRSYTIRENNQSTKRISGSQELSFSFLKEPNNFKESQLEEPIEDSQLFTKDNQKNFVRIKKTHNRNVSWNSADDTKTIEDFPVNEPEEENFINSVNFSPIFSSTPNNSGSSNNIISNFRSRRSIYKSRKIPMKRLQTKNKPKRYQTPKELKQMSVGSRFFSAINDSCANIFSTVKNIFKPKENRCESNVSNSTLKDKAECSYSFTKYMRRRDEYFSRKSNPSKENTFANFSNRNETCRTCNDTVYLKGKLANDEYLKQTVKKLKIGINLYGCDFKKISKALWPKEAYMTPAVLYKLYRKLLIK